MSGEIVALVVPTTDGSMLKVNVPGDCDTMHVFMIVPLTPPIGIVATRDPPVQATVICIAPALA